MFLLTMFTACRSYDKDYAIYDLWVAGVKVTTRNQADILGDGTVSYVGDGKSGTLTLNGTNIAECSDEEMEAFIVSTIDNLTLNLVGENKIGMGEKAPVNGIYAYDLTIKGEGGLSVGARASCIKADTLTVESGKIDTYIKTAEDEIASFIGVGLWAQEFLIINGGDTRVHYAPEFTALSYGLYCVKDLTVNGGSITIEQEEASALGVGIISSEKLTIAGGNITVYGNDDAMNAKTFAMTGGTVNACAVDQFLAGFDPETGEFVFGSDGVCRLVNKAEFSGGSLTLTALERMYSDVPIIFSKDLVLDGMKVSGGDSVDNLTEKDISIYAYTDTCIRIEKDGN
nr:carbohydrate-binding domain-containing protein [Clostridia bacterium]